MMKRHKGAKVTEGGVLVKDEDYNGDYALRIITEQDEEFEFKMTPEQLDHLNSHTRPPYGEDESENGLVTRLKFLFTGRL